MYELVGSFRWMDKAMVQPGEEPDCISPQAAPQLWAKPSDSPGFVTLHWARTSQCRHESPRLALPAHSIRSLMKQYCLATCPENAVITTPGPAVNSWLPGQQHGGMDRVPCLRLPSWPEEEAFLARHRETDFPTAEAQRDICRYGVHLVPTGPNGVGTDLYQWRISFSRAEVVVVHKLSSIQRGTVKAVKRMKTGMEENGAAPALKSYYVKTAVLWLVQDQPCDSWTGVTQGVHMVLDWLEHHLTTGSLPCFFWPAIDLLSNVSVDKLKDMISTVRRMRRQATRLLMAWCEREFYDLQIVLEDGWRPLSERQLRVCLARLLVRRAVLGGILFRPSLPNWHSWSVCFVPPLAIMSEHQLLQWRHHCHTGAYQQRCHLLKAMLVAPADLVADMRLSSLGNDMFAWDVTPLIALLTESDMQYLLGDPRRGRRLVPSAAVSAPGGAAARPDRRAGHAARPGRAAAAAGSSAAGLQRGRAG